MNDSINETIHNYTTVAEGVVGGQEYDLAFINETDGSIVVCLSVGEEVRRIVIPAQTEAWWAHHLGQVDPSGFAEFLGRTRVTFDLPDEEDEDRYPDFDAMSEQVTATRVTEFYDTDLRQNSVEDWLMQYPRVGEGTARVITDLFPEDQVVYGIASFPDNMSLYDTIKAALPTNQGFPFSTASAMWKDARKLVEGKSLEF